MDDPVATNDSLEHRLAALRDRGPRWVWTVIDDVVSCPAVVATIAYFA